MGASEPTASGFSTLRFLYPGLTGSDLLALAGPSSVLGPTRPLLTASLVSWFRLSSQGPGRLSDCGGFAEPRAWHAMSRSEGGAVFSGDIPQASGSPSLHAYRTYPSRTASKGRGEIRRRGPRARRDHPAQSRRGRSCNRDAVTVCDRLPRDVLLPQGHSLCTLGCLGLTSSRLGNAPYPLSILSFLCSADPSRLPWRPCDCSNLIQVQLLRL
jgi:hypothetical protein